MGRRTALAALLPMLLAAGCLDARPELVARHEAERIRWLIDHFEGDWPPEQIRAAHARIGDAFGPDGNVPPEGTRAWEDYRVRQQIAGTSALYAADIRAETEGASYELAEEYARVADRWPEQPNLRFLGRLREAATLERLGARREAMASYRMVLETPHGEEADRATRDLTCNLEVHFALLSVAASDRKDAARDLREARARLQAEIERRGDDRSSRHPVRRRAEIDFLAGDVSAARATFEKLAGNASSADERAELQLILGEIHQYALEDVEEAEIWYRRSAEQGALFAASAEARLRLVESSLRRGHPKIGVRAADEVLSLGARALGNRGPEAHYWRARCLLEMGRWTEALPSLREGAAGDPGSPFTLACAARWHRQMERLQDPRTQNATARLLAVAAAIPDRAPVEVPRDWAATWRLERAHFAWEEGVRELRDVAQRSGDPEEVRAAEEAAGKILRERTIFAQGTPEASPDGRR